MLNKKKYVTGCSCLAWAFTAPFLLLFWLPGAKLLKRLIAETCTVSRRRRRTQSGQRRWLGVPFSLRLPTNTITVLWFSKLPVRNPSQQPDLDTHGVRCFSIIYYTSNLVRSQSALYKSSNISHRGCRRPRQPSTMRFPFICCRFMHKSQVLLPFSMVIWYNMLQNGVDPIPWSQ